ncbi:MAG: flagellar hook-associated protein FlgK [Firmicutes bacterium]|nr:flagellar hook-associated protein FlgK [Bacillota bacterium]
MRSTFFGLEIGSRAISAQQRSLDVMGHNVANANTPGFSRQSAIMVNSYPDLQPSISLRSAYTIVGTGVAVNDIIRIRNSFYDRQYRDQNIDLGEWKKKSDELSKLELIFDENSESGLGTIYDQFWEGWQELEKDAESLNARSIVRQRGEALVNTVNQIYSQLKDSRSNLEQTLVIKMNEINSYGEQLKQLNGQILEQEIGGTRANDLRDRRDYLIDQLSNVVNVRVSEDKKGVRVSIGDYDLVDGQTLHTLELGPDIVERGLVIHQLQWSTTGQAVEITGGEVKGILDMRDTAIPYYIQQLDDLVDATVERTNQYHIEGYGIEANSVHAIVGGDDAVWSDVTIDPANTRVGEWQVQMTTATDFSVSFRDVNGAWVAVGVGTLGTAFVSAGEVSFTIDGTAAVGDTWTFTTLGGEDRLGAPLFFNPSNKAGLDKVMSLNSAILGDEGLPRLAAALQENKDGDGDNALRIAGLKYEFTMSSGTATYNDYINALAGKLGVETQEAIRRNENQDTLLQQVDNLRQETSSVSLDEEMTNMIKFQQAYNAAARVITSVDETLDKIINGMGLVGRG